MLDDISLAARWWQWVAAIPATSSPVWDRTGQFAGLHQPDDVWFLAGSFGQKVRRTCQIPAGRPVFLPVFNSYRPASLLFGRRPPVAPRASGHACLNGEFLPTRVVANHRPFMLDAVAGSPLTDDGQPERFLVRAWGIWARIDDGLPAGEHQLEIHGEKEPGGFTVHVDYQLTAVPQVSPPR